VSRREPRHSGPELLPAGPAAFDLGHPPLDHAQPLSDLEPGQPAGR
jgi:hypothetical protein